MENTGKSALGLDGNIAALIGYIFWPIALVCVIMEKENKFVRFHAIQSLLYHAAIIVAAIVLVIIVIFLGIIGIASAAAGSSGGGAIGGILGSLVSLVWMVFILAYLVGLIYAAVQAYGNKMFKLPIVGNMAEKWSNK
ncbi:MAG TPA: DUF4870 domain-containing protein [Pyrinomonadaceae bacterium]|nr:DUF4870 domain-containing protein [Pyrinomonadaceae bacterium]